MDYVRLGKTGLKVSRLCLGTMTFGSPKWRNWVMDELIGALEIKLAADEMTALEAPYEPRPVLGHS